MVPSFCLIHKNGPPLLDSWAPWVAADGRTGPPRGSRQEVTATGTRI